MAGSLTIEPGALICAEPGAVLRVSKLTATGAGFLPIVFTSTGSEPWNGIQADSGIIRHARIESATKALLGSGNFVVEETHIGNIHGTAISGAGTIRNVTIDSACGVGVSCGAVVVHGYSSTLLENVMIRNSGGNGIVAGRRCAITIDGGVIEGSGGVGITFPWDPGGTCGLTVLRSITITRGNSYPVVVPGNGAAALVRSGSDLTGNARDTLVVRGWWGLGTHDYRITRALPWRIESSCGAIHTYRHQLGRIVVEAGASFTIEGEACVFLLDLVADGTADAPAVIRGDGVRLHARGLSSDTLHIRHAELHDVRIRADSAPIVFEHVQTYGASIELATAGSRVRDLRSNGSARTATYIDRETEPPPTVTLGAGTSATRVHINGARNDGIRLEGTDATISECAVVGSARHGIVVTNGPVRIFDCNLHGNGGFGVINTGVVPANAVGNYWGDPQGPFGPNGDSVNGAVEYVPFRTIAVDW